MERTRGGRHALGSELTVRGARGVPFIRGAVLVAGAFLASQAAMAQPGAVVDPSAAATAPSAVLSAPTASAVVRSAAPVAASLSGDPAHGKVLYQACAACHSIDENDIGPKHRGVVGRQAGIVEDYAYSAALKKSGLTWDEVMLDRWLVNPSALVPGTKMFFKIDDAQSRADIIAYLKELR
jgi:cytochrome c